MLKGTHHSEETRNKISKSRNGKCSGKNNPFYGKHHSEEILEKMSDSHRNISEITRNKLIESHIGKQSGMFGKHHSEETRNILSEINRKYTLEEQILNNNVRQSIEYTKWRRNIFKNNSKQCLICASKEYLHAHHILPFSIFPDLRLDLGNGVTLCEDCHNKYHTKYGYKIYCNFETLKKFAEDLICVT